MFFIPITFELEQEGYKRGPPTFEVGDIDATIAEQYSCRKCSGQMRYEAFHKQGSYIAFAVCVNCGNRVEF